MIFKLHGSYRKILLLLKAVILSQHTVSVVIDGYTHNSTLTTGDSVPLGTQLILVCHVVGLPYGTPLSYSWTCPDGDCELEGPDGELVRFDQMIYSERILAVNTTHAASIGTYTCQVTAEGRQNTSGSFTIRDISMSCAVTHIYVYNHTYRCMHIILA